MTDLLNFPVVVYHRWIPHFYTCCFQSVMFDFCSISFHFGYSDFLARRVVITRLRWPHHLDQYTLLCLCKNYLIGLHRHFLLGWRTQQFLADWRTHFLYQSPLIIIAYLAIATIPVYLRSGHSYFGLQDC